MKSRWDTGELARRGWGREVDGLTRQLAEWHTALHLSTRDFGLEVEVTEKEVIGRVPLPGCRNEEIKVEYSGGCLRVQVCPADAEAEEARRYIKRERPRLNYSETVRLPVRVNAAQAQAEYSDGVLTVRLPRERGSRNKNRNIKAE